LIPIFDTLAYSTRLVLHTNTGSFVNRLIHGGTTATANYNVTAALATITFIAIILAGSKAHGFMKHWKNIVPHGLHPLIYVILIPIEVIGMLVRPFALTMRLAANMTGGHIAILAILSFRILIHGDVWRAQSRESAWACSFRFRWRLESPAWKSLSFSSRHMYLRYFRLCLLEWRFTFIIKQTNRCGGTGRQSESRTEI